LFNNGIKIITLLGESKKLVGSVRKKNCEAKGYENNLTNNDNKLHRLISKHVQSLSNKLFAQHLH
jgi:hypothetical protein